MDSVRRRIARVTPEPSDGKLGEGGFRSDPEEVAMHDAGRMRERKFGGTLCKHTLQKIASSADGTTMR